MRRKTRAALMTAATGVMGLSANWASAQFASFTGVNPYTQDFNGLPGAAGGTSQTNFANTNGPFSLDQAPVLGTGVGGWYAARTSGTNAPFFAVSEGANATLGMAISAGAVNDVDRALATVSTTNSTMRFGSLIRNDTANTYGTLTLNFDMEQWRNGGSGGANTSPFSFQIVPAAAAATASINGTGTFTAVSSGNLVSKIVNATPGALDGNAAANRTAQTVTLTSLAWSAGDVLVLRWDDTNEAGADDFIGIDNFKLTGVAAGKSLTWNGSDGANWNTNSANQPWLAAGLPSAFSPGDFATFGNTSAPKVVIVDDGGVTPTNTFITNTDPNGAYQFAGGKIGGILTKSGAGTATFFSPNSFSAVNLSAGVLETRINGALGAGTITLAGGTWSATDSTQSYANAIAVTGTATIHAEVPLTLTGAISGGGTLTFENISGAALLFPDFGPGGFSGNVHVASGTLRTVTPSVDGDMFLNSTLLTVDAGATIEFAGEGDSFGGIAGAGKIDVGNTVSSSFLNLLAAGDRTFSGIIAGTSGNANGLHQDGGGVLTLTGKSTFNAPTLITNGRIIVGDNVLLNTDGPLGNGIKAVTLTAPAAVSGTSSLRIGGAFEFARPLVINMSSTNAGFVSIGASTDIDVLYSGPITLATTAAAGVPTRSFQVSAGNTTATKAVTISGVISSGTNVIGVEKINAGTVVLASANTYLGPTTVTAGVLRVTGSANNSSGFAVADAAALEIGSSQTLKTLTVAGTGQVRFTADAPVKVLTIGDNSTITPLNVPATFKFDLLGNAAVVDYIAGQDTATLQATRTMIVTGYHATGPNFNNGDWKGASGITSGVAQANSSRAIGYAYSAQAIPGLPGGKFLSQTVDDSSVLLRLTLAGDATLDGTVDFNDLVKLAQNYNTTVSASTDSWWFAGDFTYDGVVDFNDLVKLAQNYNTSMPAESIPGAPANFQADLAAAFASVPEPATFSFLAAGATLLLGRRRRRPAR